ncbi:N-acetyltransferase [Paenibacillaceae bacterium]|nr:N-acetyltransferase [Paenibacillaceae bacterium]
MPHLFGPRVILREYQREDLRWMREWVNNPEITKYLSDIFLYPHTMYNTETFLDGVMENRGDLRGFVIAHRDTESYIGQLDLFEIDWKNRAAEFGIVIGNMEEQGRGYGREAIGIMQQFAIETLNLNRLQLKVLEDNVHAISCYKKCGFQLEGRLRQRQYRDGKYLDVLVMSFLREDYEARLRGAATAV